MPASSSTAPRHPIGVVARRTGLKPGLIRAWERRYTAVDPDRTDTNRRLYSDRDVERLLLLREITRLGHNIGRVADLTEEELEELIEQERQPFYATPVAAPPFGGSPASTSAPPSPGGAVAASPSRPLAAAPVPPRWDEDDAQVADSMVEMALAAVKRLDARDLEVQLERGALALSRLSVVTEVVAPLLRRVGELWAEGKLRPVHGHLATSVARGYICAVQRAHRAPASAPHLLTTTPTGQRHELGAMIAAVVAAAQGWQVTYLGPDLPAEEIAAAARTCRARAVALSIIHPADDPQLPEELQRLRRLLPPGTALLVGGGAAGAYGSVLAALEAQPVEDVKDLRRHLGTLRSSPTSPPRTR